MEWTDQNNRETINELLDYYADLLAAYGDFVHKTLSVPPVGDLPTKLRCLQTLKSLASTIDFLMKRWSLIYRGYDSNMHQATLDVRADVSESEADAVSTNGSETLALKIVLRDVPETRESPRTLDGEGTGALGRERGELAAAVSGGTVSKGSVSDPSVGLLTPSGSATAGRKKGSVSAEILSLLETGEQKTSALAAAVGRSERSVRRVLASLISDGKVSRVKKGVYRLSRSVLWTEDDNKRLINELLACYDKTIDACKDDVKKMLVADEETSDSEKIRIVKSFNACVSAVDGLMKRWSLVYLGYNTNTKQAKVDALRTAVQRDKASMENAPLEAFFEVIGRYHADTRELIETMPPPLKPPNDETGAWSYDAVTQELFPPWERAPISEVDARRRLMNRKSTLPVSLILFA